MGRHLARTVWVRAVLTGLLAFTAISAMAAEKVLDRTFTVAPGGLLTVSSDGAGITVLGGDSNQVIVHMVAKGPQNDLDELTFSAAESEGGVRVEMQRSEGRGWFNWGSWNIRANIEVTVPRSYRADMKTSGGGLRLENVAGPNRARTSGGGIVAKNVKGGLDAHTSGGGISVESMGGPVRVHTSGGGIVATGVQGDIDADTSGGSVRLLRIDGKIRASTSGGGVHCELVGANRGISASTSGGGVRLTLPKDITGTLDAESSGGPITSDLPVATTRFAQHRLNGLINGGGEAIYVRTSGGGITLSAAQ